MFNVGDIVFLIKSDRKNLFIIKRIVDTKILLYGYNNRKIIEVEEKEIFLVNDKKIKENSRLEKNKKEKIIKYNKVRNKYKALYGRILHIDGDKNFLASCLELYKDLDVFAYGVAISEKDIYKKIEKIITKITPDIIVITGHDKFNKENIKILDNYENTKYFIKAIRKIREKYENVVIISGACESNFEAQIANGANYASSPGRINIHTYDPAVIAIKVATTPYDRKVDLISALKFIEGGNSAFGGIETNGKMKLLL